HPARSARHPLPRGKGWEKIKNPALFRRSGRGGTAKRWVRDSFHPSWVSRSDINDCHEWEEK
ncbi:MAG: hypothetical protein ACRD3O_06690, partial [Terriglobia bacterium]